MARTGRPRAPFIISDEECEELVRRSKRARVNRNVAFRARIVLACADGLSNTEVARLLKTGAHTVGKWRRRFMETRLDSLYDEPRVGGPRKYSDEDVEAVVVKTLETKPKARTHWSTRKMAKSADEILAKMRRFGLRIQKMHAE